MEFGRVSIPNLGTFALVHHETHLNQGKNVLHPPFTTIDFSSIGDKTCQFQDQLLEMGMEVDDAKLLQKLLIDDATMAKNQNSAFQLHDFGSVNGDSFYPVNEQYFNKYQGLTDVTAIPIPVKPAKIKHDDDYLYGLNGMTVPTAKNPSYTRYWWPIAIGILTSCVIIYWCLSDSKTNQNHLNQQQIVPEVDTMIPSNSEVLADTTMQTDSLGYSDHTTIDIAIDNNDAAITSQPTSLHTSPCVVIVGAFKNDQNADKLLKKIASHGFKPYTAHHNGLQRIGIAYDCESIDPDTFKSKIQKTFNMQAWHLHDTI